MQHPLDAGSLCISSRIGKLFKGLEHFKGMSHSVFFLLFKDCFVSFMKIYHGEVKVLLKRRTSLW